MGWALVLVASFASRDSVRLPIFDLLLLGCGPDGHTCSLFPGHALLRETSSWVAPIDDSPKPPQCRITLTLPVVTHAIRVAFVATGGGKKDIMKQIFDTNGGLPCSLVNEATGERCSWFVDEPAVEGVSFPRRVFLLTWLISRGGMSTTLITIELSHSTTTATIV
ncbi:hypothetical protein B0T10DRAFT_591493 [Thelonectria olida]|uniref:Glucosamine/galactosamine-6-phosphate isomerase domain-containing protein n=1 Tax=Thelonectria olida TaxID=1576542 RepID=A0A9P8VP22_9HYPO|nr:hypothetical protein B0T10DRAFT_591493 [Thelonectria olida]